MQQVLDHGYIHTINVMGTDLDVVNSARVSFDKQVDTLSEKDIKLINFLVREKHDSTLRHCVMTFEVYAPLMVARQWYKHTVASTHLDDQLGWNESSRRYITENEEFYIPKPDEWRSAPENRKQGSGDAVDLYMGAKYHMKMNHIVAYAMEAYEEALNDGVAPEQARLLLPAYAMYVRWRWTASINAILHFSSLRLASDAQHEIQEYAKVIFDEVEKHFPITTSAWMQYR